MEVRFTWFTTLSWQSFDQITRYFKEIIANIKRLVTQRAEDGGGEREEYRGREGTGEGYGGSEGTAEGY